LSYITIVNEPTSVRVDLTAHGYFAAKRMAVQASALVALRGAGQAVRCFKRELFYKLDNHPTKSYPQIKHAINQAMVGSDKRFMRLAMRLARKGADRLSGKPLVGAVVAVGDRLLGQAYQGADHKLPAAISALNQAGELAEQATLYTNIEPCSASSDWQACLKQLIAIRPKRIVIGAGQSTAIIEHLKRAGIQVEIGLLGPQCRQLNEVYFKYAETGLPFVTVKFAESLDGRIATATGDSRWISGKSALKFAHQLRRNHDAVVVGIGTILADDPRLTVRLVEGRDPLRVVVDSSLRVPMSARVLADGFAHRTIIATTQRADPARIRQVEQTGAEVLVLASAKRNGVEGVDLDELLKELGRRQIASVLVEGGAGIITSLLRRSAIDRLVVIIAPKIIGKGIEAIEDLGITRLSEAIAFSSIKIRVLGQDVVFDGRIRHAKKDQPA
jgi:diaminohydroxyphosphoribosylaminopyrimidine deaminase/5-amino-6-(5-phosphoribosylamino)uracil reductase